MKPRPTIAEIHEALVDMLMEKFPDGSDAQTLFPALMRLAIAAARTANDKERVPEAFAFLFASLQEECARLGIVVDIVAYASPEVAEKLHVSGETMPPGSTLQ